MAESLKVEGHCNYESRKKEISKNMTYDFSGVIAVWCPKEQISPDFLVTILTKFDDNVSIRNRWNYLSVESETQSWGGVVAGYLDKETALAAAKEVSMASRHVKVVDFNWLLDQFMNAEVRHSMYSSGSTRVLVNGYAPFPKDSQSEERTLFDRFGEVFSMEFHDDAEDFGVICEVTYAYVSQAYAAQYIMDGLFYKPIARYTVRVQETDKEKEILRTVRQNIIEFLDGSSVI